MKIYELSFHLQEFDIHIQDSVLLQSDIDENTEAGDMIEEVTEIFEYHTYDGNNKILSHKFDPPKVSHTIDDAFNGQVKPVRGQTVRLRNDCEEADRRGHELVGYQIKKNNEWGWVSFGTEFTLDVDFIKGYIHGSGSGICGTQTTLTIRPVFRRVDAGPIEVGYYDEDKGELKIGDKLYNEAIGKRDVKIIDGLKKGDRILVRALPKPGYYTEDVESALVRGGSAANYVAYEEHPFFIEVRNEHPDALRIIPYFNLIDNKVQIEWGPPPTLPKSFRENEDINKKRGMIFHNHPDRMPDEEKAVLYEGVEELMIMEKEIEKQIEDERKKLKELEELEELEELKELRDLDNLENYYTDLYLEEVVERYAEEHFNDYDNYFIHDWNFWCSCSLCCDAKCCECCKCYDDDLLCDPNDALYCCDSDDYCYCRTCDDCESLEFVIDYTWEETDDLGEEYPAVRSYHYLEISDLNNYLTEILEEENAVIKAENAVIEAENAVIEENNAIIEAENAVIEENNAIILENIETFLENIDGLRKDRRKKIEDNYPKYRDAFPVYTIEQTGMGEIITLYAEPEEGYTVHWRMVTEDTGTPRMEGAPASQRFAHYGNSFSFVVDGDNPKVFYYFSEIDDDDPKCVFSGQVFRQDHSIKTTEHDPDKRIWIPNAFVSVDVYEEEGLEYIDEKNNTTYRTYAQTDENGSFSIYLPNAVFGYYSIKISVGDKTYLKSVPAGVDSEWLLEIPFMGSLKVTEMNISGVCELSHRFDLPPEPESRTLSVKTWSEFDRQVSRVLFHSYDSAGRRRATGEAILDDNDNWNWVVTDTSETFVHGGRITVELFDNYGMSHGEIESGYELFVTPPEGPVNLPGNLGADWGDGFTSEIGTNQDPDVDLGTYENEEPKHISQDTYSIFIGLDAIIPTMEEMRDVLKETDTDDRDKFSESISTIRSLLTALTPMTTPEKKISEVKTGKGERAIKVSFEAGVMLNFSKLPETSDSEYKFHNCVILMKGKLEGKQTFYTYYAGLPFYLTISGSLDIGLAYIIKTNEGISVDPDDFGYFPSLCELIKKLEDLLQSNIFMIQVGVGIGAGIGTRGAFSVGVQGDIGIGVDNSSIKYKGEKFDNEGAVTFSFGASVDIDLFFVPFRFRFFDRSWTVKEWPENSNSMIDYNSMLQMAAQAQDEGDSLTYAGEISRAENMSGWLPQHIEPSSAVYEPVPATVLQSGVYKHPQPRLIHLEGEKLLMLFLNDDLTRDDYDRTAVCYSVFDGAVWSEPVILHDDGTLDYEPDVACLGDGRILVTWGSADRTFGNDKPEVKDMLNSMDIYSVFFDRSTGLPEGEITQLTDDEYANTLPRVAFDTNSDKVMVFYNKTDYNTEGVELDEEDIETVECFLHNSYSLIAYRLNVDGEWLTTYYEDEGQYIEYENIHGEGSLGGQRFVSFDIPGVIDSPRIEELALASYNGLTLIVYTLDLDGDPATEDDQELFMMIYIYGERSITHPIAITDNLTPDNNPQIARHDNTSYLFWRNDENLSYLDLSFLVREGLELVTSPEGTKYYVVKEGFGRPENATVEPNLSAATGYTLTVGQDGNIYLVWSEYISVEDPEDPDVSNRKGERHLYAAMYDAMYYRYEDEEGNPYYQGAWGDKYRLTGYTGNMGEHNNDQTIAVDENGQITIVNRRFEIVEDELFGGTMESDTSDLVARTFLPVSTLEIDDIVFNTEYPRGGASFGVTAAATNYGFKPSERVNFVISIIDDGVETLQNEEIEHGRLVAGGSATARATFRMPDNVDDVTVRVTAWEEGMKDEAVVRDFPVGVGHKMNIQQPQAYFVGTGIARVSARILNVGNKSAENITITLQKAGDSSSEPVILYETTHDKVSLSDVITFREDFVIPDDWYDSTGSVKLEMDARYTVIKDDEPTEVIDETREIYVSQKDDPDTTVLDILISGEQTEDPVLDIFRGEPERLRARIISPAAERAHRLIYSSSDPDVVHVDGAGNLTALKKGTAEISIDAVPTVGSYLNNAHNVIFTDTGEELELDEYGSPIVPDRDDVDETPVFTKTVTVNTHSAGIFYGDVNDDWKITVADAIIILRQVAGLIAIEEKYDHEALIRARVSTQTGKVEIKDAILVLRYIVGLIREFPAEAESEDG